MMSQQPFPQQQKEGPSPWRTFVLAVIILAAMCLVAWLVVDVGATLHRQVATSATATATATVAAIQQPTYVPTAVQTPDVAAPTPKPTSGIDSQFLSYVKAKVDASTYTDSAMISSAKGICGQLASGMTEADLVAAMRGASSFASDQRVMAVVTGGAVDLYCPEYTKLFH
jgi:hypothetical protein